MKNFFNFEDFNQLVIGAFALAAPLAFSEEIWILSTSLPLDNLILLILLSVSFLSIFAYQNIFQSSITKRLGAFILRIFYAYLITGIVVCLILFAIDKFPIFEEPITAIKRALILMLPASIGAIVVDGFDKE